MGGFNSYRSIGVRAESPMPVEVLSSESGQLIARIEVPSGQAVPQPGLWLDWGFGPCLVLLRRHRYSYRAGRYELRTITLEVKQQGQPPDSEWWNGQWVIGNPNCFFNARSPLLRCAVFPEGPCTTCSHFQERSQRRMSF